MDWRDAKHKALGSNPQHPHKKLGIESKSSLNEMDLRGQDRGMNTVMDK